MNSPFYNKVCAKAITAIGRKACITAKNSIESGILQADCQILCANTDSVTFRIQPDKFSLLEARWEALNKDIQLNMGSDVFRFELETGKLALMALYTSKIKQTIRLSVPYDVFKETTKGKR